MPLMSSPYLTSPAEEEEEQQRLMLESVYSPRQQPQTPPPPTPPPPPPAAPVAVPQTQQRRTYGANVEQWRPAVERHFKPEDVDKALFVIEGESGGDPEIPNREGSGALGLFQIMPFHGVNATDPEESIRWAANRVYNERGDWGDWGEGVTYEGKPFGALGAKSFDFSPGAGTGQPTAQERTYTP